MKRTSLVWLATLGIASAASGQGIADELTSVSVGSEHACGVHPTGALYCWGNGVHGQLGNGVAADSEVGPVRVQSSVRFRLVSAGATYTCALSAESEAYCWGTDFAGALGDASVTGTCMAMPCALLPVRVAATMTFDTLSAGYEHTCALRKGVAYCWGRNGEGQLGREWSGEECDGVPCGRAALPVVTPLRFDMLSVRGRHSCALSDGAAYCWGDNEYGELAAPSTLRTSTTPRRVPTTSRLRSVSSGGLYSCAVTRQGTIECWGQLPTDSPLETEIQTVHALFSGWKGPRFAAVGAGGTHTCALAVNGAVYCWGGDMYNRLGSDPSGSCGELPCWRSPLRVPLNGKARALSVGGTSSCAIGRGGLSCWGGTAGERSVASGSWMTWTPAGSSDLSGQDRRAGPATRQP